MAGVARPLKVAVAPNMHPMKTFRANRAFGIMAECAFMLKLTSFRTRAVRDPFHVNRRMEQSSLIPAEALHPVVALVILISSM